MPKFLRLLFVLLFLLCASCTSSVATTPDIEEPLVYKATIEATSAYGFLFVDQTHGYNLNDRLSYIRKEMPELEQETLDSYITRNSQPYSLRDSKSLEDRFTLISQQEIDSIFVHHGNPSEWDELFKRFPQGSGLSELSGVGFNKDMT